MPRTTTNIRLTRWSNSDHHDGHGWTLTQPGKPDVYGTLDDTLQAMQHRADLTHGYWLREGEYGPSRTWTWVQL